MEESEEAATDSALNQVEELRHANAVLQTEIEMFECFLSRLDSLSLASPQKQPEAENRAISESSSRTPPEPKLLTLEQKCYVAARELEVMKQELKQLDTRLRNAKIYKAAIEDSDTRLAEIQKETRDFEQFLAKVQQTTLGQAQRAQKVMGFIERRFKAKEVLIERMQRRNKFLQTQVVKQQRTAQHKELMQEKLCKIDLEHMKQKNSQCREILLKFQEQLLCQRVLVRKSQQCLQDYKEELKKEMQESESLSKNIASHEEKLARIREQQQKVEKERAQAEALNKKLKARGANFRVPDVMIYVESKVTNDRLKQTVKSLERKARIAERSSRAKKTRPGDSSGCSTSVEH